MPLTEYAARYPEMLGTHPRKLGLPEGQLPILIKFIDADRDLSVQVHPDDSYARAHENGALGKTEMWYVLDAAQGSELIYGFNRDVDETMVRRAIADDSIEKLLRRVPIERDDVFYIESGTVHAIGAGSLIVEVQENSNLTYRMYDYHRIDKYGNERELHIDKALQVANLHSSISPRQPIRVLNYRQGYATELLCRCRYFQAERMIVNTSRHQNAWLRTDSTSFAVLVCTRGCAAILWQSEAAHTQDEAASSTGTVGGAAGISADNPDHGTEYLLVSQGDTVFLPADGPEIRIHGNAQFLYVKC